MAHPSSSDWFPSWVQTVGAMADKRATGWTGYGVKGWCSECGLSREVDVERLVRVKGRDYSLIGRRSPCPRCGGWVRFHFRSGVYRPLWRDRDIERWLTSK